MTEQEQIEATHPMNTGRHDLYKEALRLVGERHAKYDLVDLVNWFLVRLDLWEPKKDGDKFVFTVPYRNYEDAKELLSGISAAVLSVRQEGEPHATVIDPLCPLHGVEGE